MLTLAFFLHCIALGIVGGMATAGTIELFDLRGLHKTLVLAGVMTFIGITSFLLAYFYLGA